MLHLVLHFCLQSFGPAYFENSFVRRFAEWGAVQFSSLFCLEGLILAIKYGRSISKAEPGENDQLDTGLFWKRHALEIYPIYLVACVASWAFQYLVGGVNDWRQLVLSVTTLDVSVPRNLNPCSLETWPTCSQAAGFIWAKKSEGRHFRVYPATVHAFHLLTIFSFCLDHHHRRGCPAARRS